MSRAAVATALLFIGQFYPLFAQQTIIDTPAVRREIFAVIRAQEMSWNRGNIEGFMEGYARGDSTRFASGGSVSYGWRSMLERYLKGYPDSAAMGRLAFSGIDVTPLSQNSAMAFGRWELTRKSDRPWGYFTLLFRRLPEGWRIVHDHTSSAPAK